MNSFIAVMTVIAGVLFSNNQTQESPAENQSVFEKRAIADAQRALASDLDAELPRLPFANWIERLIGPRAAVIWQLSECGDQTESTGDIRACVEANTILADGRGVIIRISVGTFKKGITEAPAFYFGVIERDGELRLLRRLRDLQQQLSEPRRLANSPTVKLPDVNMSSVRLPANGAYVADLPVWSWPAWIWEDLGQPMPIEDPAPAKPPPPVELRPSKASLNAEKSKLPGAVLQGAAIVKAQPSYPANAKRFNASGVVEVRITISATGRVTGAQVISGHPLLREAAVEAARKWVFSPTTVNGVPVETQLSLSFVFTVPQ